MYVCCYIANLASLWIRTLDPRCTASLKGQLRVWPLELYSNGSCKPITRPQDLSYVTVYFAVVPGTTYRLGQLLLKLDWVAGKVILLDTCYCVLMIKMINNNIIAVRIYSLTLINITLLSTWTFSELKYFRRLSRANCKS